MENVKAIYEEFQEWIDVDEDARRIRNSFIRRN